MGTIAEHVVAETAPSSWYARLVYGWSPLAATPAGRRILTTFGTSTISTGLMGFALPWLTLLLGGSASLVALFAAATTATNVILLVPAGIWADRVSRRPLLQIAAAIQSLAALILLGVTVEGMLSIPILAITAVALAAAGCVEYAAGFGSIRLLVPDSDIPASTASLTILMQIGYFGGPALGGLLFVIVGRTGLMIVIATACLVGLVVVSTLRSKLESVAMDERPPIRAQIIESMRIVWQRGVMRAILVTGGTWNIAASVSFPILLVLLRLKGYAAPQVTIVLAAGIFGSIFASPLVRRLVNVLGAPRATVCAGIGEAAMIAAMGVAGGPITMALCYGVLMVCNTTVASVLTGERARLAPLKAQSATSATGLAVHLSGSLLGALLSALLVGLISVPVVWLLGSGLMFIVMAVLAAWIHCSGPQRPGHEEQPDSSGI